MFFLQPGQGLGFTGAREIAFSLGGGAAVIIPPVIPPGDDTGGGRGSGSTTGVQPLGYTRTREDDLLETRKKRILQEDEDIIALIAAMLSNRLM